MNLSKAQHQLLTELAQGDIMIPRDPNGVATALVKLGFAAERKGKHKGKTIYIYSITAEGRKAVRDE